jgi:branched-chain amino acid transport system ATP-binding protein
LAVATLDKLFGPWSIPDRNPLLRTAAAVMTALLRVEGLSKSFGALRAIDDLSFEVGEGEALGILGPNGAGKSTLFNLITGDLRASAGVICFKGRDITRLPSFERCRLGIGRTYQIPAPFGGMTVFENVLVAAFKSGRGESACHGLSIDVLDRTDLLTKSNLIAGQLTLLDRKRLELARALATEPTLLLLDEIAGGLTEAECQDLIAMVEGIIASGVAIVWIEHVVHVLIAVVRRLLVINFGRHLAEGEPQAVMANPVVQEVYMGIEAE